MAFQRSTTRNTQNQTPQKSEAKLSPDECYNTSVWLGGRGFSLSLSASLNDFWSIGSARTFVPVKLRCLYDFWIWVGFFIEKGSTETRVKESVYFYYSLTGNHLQCSLIHYRWFRLLTAKVSSRFRHRCRRLLETYI